MMLKRVVLPAPLGPMSPTTWPASTENVTWSRATTPPNLTARSRTSRSATSRVSLRSSAFRGHYAGGSGGAGGDASPGGGCICGAGGSGVADAVLRCGGGPMAGRELLWTTDADGKTRVRSTRINSQYASAARIASRPMMGRKTNGGLVITSKPLCPELLVSTTGDALGVGDCDSDGVGVGDGDGDADGVGVGGEERVGVGAGDGAGVGDGLGGGGGGGVGLGTGVCATSTSQTGTTTRTLRNLTRRPKGPSDRGPRDRPGGRRFRESPPWIQDASEAAPHHVDLRRVEQAVDAARQVACLKAG